MSLKVWLPLNGDLRNQGCSNPNISLASGNTWTSSGKIGNSSLTLTKLQTILPTSSCMTGAKEVSYCYWVKVNTAWSANWLDGIRWIETDGSATSTARQEFYTNCTLVGTWYKGGSIAGKAFTPGIWTHLAATINYNTGEAKFYINGTLSGTTTNVDTTYYCRGDFYIGDNGTDICENDARIYDHCLSAAEVREISQGLVLHYKLDSIQDGILDSSGYGHKTSTIGTLTLDEDDSARYTNSIKFNGSNTAIKITENNWAVQGMREMTINVWAKSSSWPGAHLFSCTESGGFNTENGSSGYLRFPVNVYTNEAQTSTAYKYDSQEIQISALSTDKWNMLTFVYDSTGTRTYINGVLHHTYTNVSYGIHFNLNARLFLGCEANGASAYSPYFNGKMNDFRMYCTALSADDILQLYHTGAKIDNKKNLHTYELIENSSTIKINKRGQTLCNELQEVATMKFYKTDSIIETHVLNEF